MILSLCLFQGNPATLMTNIKKRIKHIGIFLKDEDEEEEEDEDEPKEEVLGRGARRAQMLDSRTRVSD